MNEKSTVLIVDDQRVMRETIALMLDGDGFQLEFADNGPRALEKAAQLLPDIILLDILMPGMDGFEVCRRLRADEKLSLVPVVMVTALNDRDSWVKGIEAGADDFVFKPFDSMELQTRVRNIAQLNRYRRLVAEQMKFDWVTEQSEDGFLLLDDAGSIIYANTQSSTYLELATRDPQFVEEAFLPLAQKQYRLEPKEAWEGWPQPAPEGHVRYLLRPETPVSRSFWLRVDLLNLPPGIDAAHLVRLRDVTKDMALQQDVWRFQHMIFHKLRTPLAVAMNSVELLTRQGDDGSSEKLQQLSKRAMGGLTRLRDEVNDILQYVHAPALARPGDGFPMYEFQPLLERLCRELKIEQLETAGLAEVESVRLPVTSRAMELICWEILENTRKFHPQGEPLVQVFASRLKSGEVGLWIGDNGARLSPEQLALVWVPYFQGEKSFTGERKGMGLGLSMVAALVWQIGGHYRMYNRQGGTGVVVELIFPQANSTASGATRSR